MSIRRDANTLTSAQRSEFISAVLTLKREGVYDQFVLRHARANMSAIHRCPAFLPWHRRFVLDFERELQRVSGNPDLGVPYWNWPEGDSNASMWDDDLLGGNGDLQSGFVLTGPFRQGQWTLVNMNGNPAGSLVRRFGEETWARTLPTEVEIDDVINQSPYDESPWNSASAGFRNQVEGFLGPNLHNRGHGWVGGSMLPMTSPNDPVFFMHHAMVDKVWYEWQLRFSSQGYQPVANGPFGQNLRDPMDSTPQTSPGNRPIDMWDSEALGIEYDQLREGSTIVPRSTQLTVGNAITSTVSSPGEAQRFEFEVPVFGPYTIQTSGDSDTLMTLFGPNNSNAEVDSDDDSGEGFNALISQTLSSGQYIVEVRLYDPSTTGAFGIALESNEAASVPRLPVNGGVVNGSITADRESDLYRFDVTITDIYSVETSGQTDTFLTLYGPNSQTTVIAQDDDSGTRLNSLIRRQLSVGQYFVRIRHYSPTGAGPYTIRVQS